MNFYIKLVSVCIYTLCLGLVAPTVVAAARSTHVVIKNNTGHNMTFVSGSAKHGVVTQKPPRTIAAGAVGEFFAESNGVATGTEGSVVYRLDTVNGNATFNWDNPFVGSNSAGGAAPNGLAIEVIGDKGNRTLAFFSIHDANNPTAVCSAEWVVGHVGTKPEDRLDGFSKDVGFLSTPLKRLGISGWVDTGCDATSQGWAVRDAQHSTDGFWTIDVKLAQFTVNGKTLPGGQQRYVRIEVEPNTPAHAKAGVRANQFINFGGRVLIDTHHGEELIEVHPFNPITLATEPTPFGPDTCVQGFVWREAFPSDHVCVSLQTRDQTREQNGRAGEHRQPSGGAFGIDTCKQGFVWREAIPNDHVCVTLQIRASTAEDNRHAVERRVRK